MFIENIATVKNSGIPLALNSPWCFARLTKQQTRQKKNYCPFDDTHNNCSIVRENLVLLNELTITTVLVNTRLWRTKHPRRRFQNFRQSYTLSTNRIEIHQSQPLVWWLDLLDVLLARWNWWISIRSVDNMYDCDNFGNGCFVFQSRVSTKTVVKGQTTTVKDLKS